MPTSYLLMMLVGYLLTITVETAVLVALLSRRHPVRVKLFAGVWLTACTYPVVWVVLPPLFDPETQRWQYLLVAETFAPAAECALFWFAFIRRLPAPDPSQPDDDVWWVPPPLRRQEWATLRDMVAITLANLASFGLGEVIHYYGGFEWLLSVL